MKTFNTMLKTVIKNGDASVYNLNGELRIIIRDFDGFDDDYNEQERELKDENAVDELIEYLEKNGDGEGDFYRYYTIGKRTIVLGYESMDI